MSDEVKIETKLAGFHKWQIEEITKALAEADAGDFATEKEMEALFKKWTQ